MTEMALNILRLKPLRDWLLRARSSWSHALHVGRDTPVHEGLVVVKGIRIICCVVKGSHDMLVLLHFCQKLLKMTAVGCQI